VSNRPTPLPNKHRQLNTGRALGPASVQRFSPPALWQAASGGLESQLGELLMSTLGNFGPTGGEQSVFQRAQWSGQSRRLFGCKIGPSLSESLRD